jgi:hypothetical protein
MEARPAPQANEANREPFRMIDHGLVMRTFTFDAEHCLLIMHA